MARPESEVEQAIYSIRDRLTKAQIIKNALGRPQDAIETFLGKLKSTDTPIARRSEAIVSAKRAQQIEHSADDIRNWMINHAPTYDEEPSFRVEDESGWGYRDSGFQISADDITKPSSLESHYLLSITEISPHDSAVSVWFAVLGGKRYNLELRFFAEPITEERLARERALLEYRSDDKAFGDMPEDDSIIIADLLKRVSSHLTQGS